MGRWRSGWLILESSMSGFACSARSVVMERPCVHLLFLYDGESC